MGIFFLVHRMHHTSSCCCVHGTFTFMRQLGQNAWWCCLRAGLILWFDESDTYVWIRLKSDRRSFMIIVYKIRVFILECATGLIRSYVVDETGHDCRTLLTNGSIGPPAVL